MSNPSDSECFQFDALHVVSDLHLGGVRDANRNFQIFHHDQGELFKQTINRLVKKPIGGTETHDGKWCLVVNGDLVDFLAEPSPKCFDPDGASNKLKDIIERTEFKPVWDALRTVAKTPKATLVIVLGNHDIELALPWVRQKLLSALSGGDAAAEGRIHLVVDGTGFHCLVGNARVLCVHGNEVDEMNYVNYERLREIGRDIQFGRAVTDWIPNGGSQLVIEAMNQVKQRFPFVDLLKPESPTVLGPTLLALDSSLAPIVRKLVAPFTRGGWAGVMRPHGLLSDEPPSDMNRTQRYASESDRRYRQLLREWDVQLAPIQRRDDRASTHLKLAERSLRQGLRPQDLIPANVNAEQLGLFDGIWARVTGKELHEALRLTLNDVISDQSFERKYEDSTFKRLDEEVGNDIKFLITGHTHFPRAIVRNGNQGFYFNSGTWARRIRFTPAMLASEQAFKPVFDALKTGTMQALDAFPDLVLSEPMVVSLWHNGKATRGKLQLANANAATGFDAVPNSESPSL